MQREVLRKTVDEFLENLKNVLIHNRLTFDFKLLNRHLQLYRFYLKPKTYFLFIHLSRVKDFSIPPPWEEISRFLSSAEIFWAVILLKASARKSDPLGFFIAQGDFMKMKSKFNMNRLGLLRIKGKDLQMKHRFNTWDKFLEHLCADCSARPLLRPDRAGLRLDSERSCAFNRNTCPGPSE
jgi:hypothetical protein